MKTCTKCFKIKLLSKFHISKLFKDGHNNWCKECMSKYNKEYRKNLEVRKRELVNWKKYFLNHRNICLLRSKQWKKNHKEQIKIYRKKYERDRQLRDLNYKLFTSMRKRISIALRYNLKSTTTIKLIGCSIKFLKKYLQNKFRVGMSWKNYGRGRGKWHVDHIRPCASFNLSKSNEQKKCFNYKNLQPLWMEENCAKGDTIN